MFLSDDERQLNVELPRYRSYNGLIEGELAFNLSPTYLASLGFPITHFSSISDWNEFVFVTAADDRFFCSAMDAIALVQRYFPGHKVYFYDLANYRSPERADKVSRKARFSLPVRTGRTYG
jgi:hypothetical protein